MKENKNLNTSYVKVQLITSCPFQARMGYLNTSYVKVQQ